MLDSFTFTLDRSGDITQMLHADGTKFVYTYDQRHRVTEGDLKDSGSNNVRTYGYTYDAASNVTAKTLVVASPYSSSSWTYGYDNANEQTSITLNGGTPETRTYDAWGRMATRTQGTSSATFGYRYGGRLYSYATNFAGEAAETMQYRGDGRLYSRVSGETTKIYHYDRGWNAINEEDESGGLNGSSVYAPGADVGERLAYTWGTLSSSIMACAYHDQLGSTRVWRWQNKNLIGKNDFAPYGEKYVGTTVAPRDYALHVQDPYTQMYHAPYREYAAAWGRWTTRDPLGMVDGPNVYAYVMDSPTQRLDPKGLACVGTWRRPWWCPWCAPQWECITIPNGCADRAAEAYESAKKRCLAQENVLADRQYCDGRITIELCVTVPNPNPLDIARCLNTAYQQYRADLIKCALGSTSEM